MRKVTDLHYSIHKFIANTKNSHENWIGDDRLKHKQKFLEGRKVTHDNQIFGTPNSKAKEGTGNSPNDDVKKNKSKNE